MEEADATSAPANGNAIDGKVWETFQKGLSQVQAILDQNRVLIREINQNHESKIPENLTRNVGLIRELNNNIARVVELYANLSTELVKPTAENLTQGEAAKTPNTETNCSNTSLYSGQKKLRHE